MKRRDIRKKIRRCLGKKNISLAKKICNRSLRYAVLPRAAPFLCTKCGFATIMLKRIEEHVCMKKNSSVNDLERDIKVAQMGVRSRCKDAMGVLERLPNPQSIRLPKFRILENEPVIGMCGITSLNLSSHDSSKAEIPVACCSSDENSSSRQIVEKSFYCIESEVAFPNYEDFKRDHCTPSPGISSAKVSADFTISVQSNHRITKCSATHKFNMRCTACEIESDKFETLGEFHEHIMKCRNTSR